MHALTQPIHKPLSEDEARLAETSRRALLRLLENEEPASQKAMLRLSIEQPDGETAQLPIPRAALPVLLTLLGELSLGKNVVVLAADTEVTTQQAADFLRVSRPYLVKLLESGHIPFRRVGPRRRVRL